ncbi:collagenase [Clostridium rectalis]|uniref:collagenase n=1 Tax=Clostridium rectalis TaxID=2040295 RepID=UPI000F641ADB|nr:collagenase [Clostridium rectalis]
MRKSFLKVIGILTTTFLITINSYIDVCANQEYRVKSQSLKTSSKVIINQNNLSSKIHDEVENVKDENEAKTENIKLLKNTDQRLSTNNNENKKYTMADFNKLSYKETINIISSINWYDIEDLMQYSEDARQFYADEKRVQALIQAVIEKGNTYTKGDNKGIPTLIEVLRGGYYLAYYNDGMKSFYSMENREKCIPAILAIESNKNFRLGNDCQNEVVKAVGLLINNTTSNVEIINKATPILKQYNNNFNDNILNISKGNAIHSLMEGIEYSLRSYCYHNNTEAKDTKWYGNINEFIDQVSKFVLIGNANKENSWLINNGIFYTGKLAKFHSNTFNLQKIIEDALKIYPYLGEQYFKAIESITYDFNGIQSNGNRVDIEKIKEQGKKYYLPNTFTFDDGKMIIKSGSNVSEDKIKRLYWASKEVKAQFHRVVGNDRPLEQGNADDVLTMVIYNSPEEYKLNSILYGYSTENGGIYIEGIGSFFTYERTTEQSVFSLEELFRHEFCHYLQGRYLVPGIWGKSDFYKGSDCRLTWFEEGSAEFFAGATRKENVVPRKSQVSGLSREYKDRYSADKLFHSRYGVWDFYYYGFAFSDYMYNRQPEIFNNIVNYIKNNDVLAYDEYIKKLSENNIINNEYQKHMEDLINKYDSLNIPLVSDDYLNSHENINASQVFSNIKDISKLDNIKVQKEKSQFFNTFTLRGEYKGGFTKGGIKDWKELNNKCNEYLNKLDLLGWTGYKTVTCYFTNYRLNAYGEVQCDIVFHGMLSDSIETETNDYKEVEPNNSFETANGPLVSDKTLFGDFKDKTSDYYYFDVDKEEEIDITVNSKDNIGINFLIYNQNNKEQYISYPNKEGQILHCNFKAAKGRYYIVVYKFSGEAGTYDLLLKEKLPKKQLEEKEDNNSFNNAFEIFIGSKVLAKLDSNDTVDIFSFYVSKNQNIFIEMTKLNDIGMNWMLYREDDLDNYICYANRDNNRLYNNINLKSGKYYLYVYRYSNEDGNYFVEIN